jgi:hypothetical protein
MRIHFRRTGPAAVLFLLAHVSIAQAQTAAEPPPPTPSSTPTSSAPAPSTGPALAPSPRSTDTPQTGPATSDAPKPSFIELSTLKMLHDKGVFSDAEYESALHDVGDSTGAQAANGTTLVAAKWATTIYGFVESDYIYDSSQSFNELAGNGQVLKANKYAGAADRTMFSIRNSRFGFREKAPAIGNIRVSGQMEFDFLGNQPQTTYSGQTSSGSSLSESSYFTSPTLRVRHYNVKVETPVVDLLFGQYWALFGWQSVYHPNTVEIQGVPGQLYSRTPQLRISKTMKTDPMTFEVAVAALRPPQRNSAMPEGQAGLRFAFNHWQGAQTAGATSTSIQPASIAVTGDMKAIRLTNFPSGPETAQKVSSAIAVDAFLPVLPASKESRSNALSLNGEFVTGYGTSDQYTGLTGGITFPAVPNPAMKTPAPTYNQDIDNGIATFDSGGGLHFIQWTSYLVGAQYYLPGVDGRVWVSGNISRTQSGNSHDFGSAAATRRFEQWADGNVFFDATPALRFGAEYANFYDVANDGTHASNRRIQGSAFLLF